MSPGESATLRAKDDYWGGPVCIGSIKFVHVPGNQTAYEALQKGEVNGIAITDVAVIHDLESSGEFAGVEAVSAGRGVALNNRPTSAFHDVRLRRAAAAAIDPAVIDTRVFEGHGLMSSALAAPGMKLFTGVEGPAYDFEEAQRLVAEAKGDGVSVDVSLMCPTSQPEDLVLALQGLLNRAGFNVTPEIVSVEHFLTRWAGGSFDMACAETVVYDDSPLRQLNQLTCDSPVSRLGFCDGKFDALIEELYLAGSMDESQAALQQVQQRWNEVVPMVLINGTRWFSGFDDTVHGVYVSSDGKLAFDRAYLGD